MVDFDRYAQQNYRVLKPKRSLCIQGLLEIPENLATEENLRSILRHLKYEVESADPDEAMVDTICAYLGIATVDLIIGGSVL